MQVGDYFGEITVARTRHEIDRDDVGEHVHTQHRPAVEQSTRQFGRRSGPHGLTGAGELFVTLTGERAVQFETNSSRHPGLTLLDIYGLTHPRQASQNSADPHVFGYR